MLEGAYAQEVPEGHLLKVNSVPNILFIPGSGFTHLVPLLILMMYLKNGMNMSL